MKERSFDEMIAYFNRRVSEMDIAQDYKMELLGMVTALGLKHEKTARQWIPCSERLPKEGIRAVLLYSNEKISGGVYMGDRVWNVDYNDTDLSTYIIAWMPLPETYKGEES